MSSITTKATSDFAHLFELFDQLASRRRNTLAIDDNLDLVSVPVPEDLEPVFRNLVSLVRTRNHQMRGGAGGDRSTRRKTVSVAPTNGVLNPDLESEEGSTTSTPQFPSDGRQYPFTFKMMLHKLYELEEWGKKVKDVLERSQNEYKSLTLQKQDMGGDSLRKEKGRDHGVAGRLRVEFAVNAAPSSQKRNRAPSIAAAVKAPGRPRRHTVAPTNGRNGAIRATGTPHWVITTASVAAPPPPVPQEGVLRAVKKRCIGRRKSLGGKSDWAYDVAVTSRAHLDGGRRMPSVGTRRRSSNSNMNKDEGLPNPEGGRPVIVRRRVISVATASPWGSAGLA